MTLHIPYPVSEAMTKLAGLAFPLDRGPIDNMTYVSLLSTRWASDYNQQQTMAYVAPKTTAAKPATPKPEPKPAPEKPKPTTSTPYSPPARTPITTQFGEPRTPYTPSGRPTVVVPEKPKIEFDASKVYEGAKVKHKVFGEGTVTKMDKAEKHIRVRFSVGEKTFIYPDAFHNGYLSV